MRFTKQCTCLLLLCIVFLTLITHLSYAQSIKTIPDRAESVTLPALTSDALSPLKLRRAGASPTPFSISIPAPSQERRAAETAAVSLPGTPYKIGFGRDVPQLGSAADTAARLHWQTTPQASMIAAISFTSPQAFGIRLGILVRSLPAETTLRFYAQGAETTYEISGKEIMETIKRNLDAGDSSDAARTYWAPLIEGEEATMEIELPQGISSDTVEIAIPRISHFFLHPLAVQGGNIIEIGEAAYCEIDATCYNEWSERNATARMIFGKDGDSYLCSGTLLNDTITSFIPHFLSANHCISTQTVASTLETDWFYRSTACNSGTLNPGYKKLTGGATLLYHSEATDTSFMRLNASPPAGVVYAGWSPNSPEPGTAVTGIHHPQGDLQKISFGTIQSLKDCITVDPEHFLCVDPTEGVGEFIEIAYTQGTTEGGSSGSGLFKTIGSNHYLIGQLFGGAGSCSDSIRTKDYGRFDLAYTAALRQWLNPGTTSPLYFPHIDTSFPWQTEIAIINTGDQTVTGTLRGLSDEGQLVGTTKAVTLSAHGRRQITVASEFTNHTDIGYIIFDTDSAAVQGYTKLYQAGIYRAAIPAVKEVNTSDIYISHIDISAQWRTDVSLLNTTSATKALTITFNNGLSVPYTLNANQSKTFNIAQEFFNNQPRPDIQSAVITNASGVIGLELFGSTVDGNRMDGILLTDKTTATLYYPHVDNNGWWTGIVAYNPSNLASTITITPYTVDGSPLSSTSPPPIAGKGKYVGTVTALGLPSQTAWFKIISTRPITGFELFGTTDNNQLAAYADVGGTGAKSGVFAKIEKNGGWTGIAFVNTEVSPASVTLTAYNDTGTAVATQMLPVGGYAKVVKLAEAIFSPASISSATYIAYSSNRNVIGFQLNGSSDGMMLDALPGLAGTNAPPPVVCSYSISSSSKSFTSSGGTGSVDVTTTSGCSWTASSNAWWITITAGISGSGNGTVYYSILANTSTSTRSGTLIVEGKTFTVNQSGTSDPLLGNFKFVYKIISMYTDRITMNTKSSSKTSESTYIYTGYDADYPSVTGAAGAWYPSLSEYIIASVLYSTPYVQGYVFSINADNTLPGCWMISSDYGSTWSSCYSFIIPSSHKSPLGSWDISIESKQDPIAINEVFEKKISEDQQAQAQRTEYSSSIDGNLVSKINEVKAMIENHR